MSENKVLILASQDDITEMARKIEQNKQESKAFAETYAQYKAGELESSVILRLGETPYSLQIAGARNLPLTLTQRTIRNAQNPYNVQISGHSSGHEIPDSIVRQLPELIRNPLFVIEDDNHNLRVIIDVMDNKNDYVVCPITLNRLLERYDVNIVTSIFGKRDVEEYIKRSFEKNAVKAMNKEKAESLFQTTTAQYGKVETTISFDDSIAYTTANVKYPEQKNLTKILYNSVETDDSKPNTYSRKEIKTMELNIFERDERSLQQWLDDYEAQKKEVDEKSLCEISTEEDYAMLTADDKRLYDDFCANRNLLVEARVALDYVKTSTFTRPSVENCRNVECMSLMSSKEEYAHALIVLTNGFDERMSKALDSTRDKPFASRLMTINNYNSTVNAPLMDEAIAGLIATEKSNEKTVADLVKVIKITEEQRDDLYISDENVIDDTLCAVANDKEKLNLLHVQDLTEQKEIPEIVESNDGYVMNTSRVTAENKKAIGEKVNGNEVVHNEAPKATTTDPSKVGGNVKLEEANNKGTEDKKPSVSNKQERDEER